MWFAFCLSFWEPFTAVSSNSKIEITKAIHARGLFGSYGTHAYLTMRFQTIWNIICRKVTVEILTEVIYITA